MEDSKNKINDTKVLRETMLVLIIMTILAVITVVTSYPLVGAGTLAIMLYLLAERKIRNRTFEEIGFNFKGTFRDIQNHWVLISLPMAANILCIVIAMLVLPEFYYHVYERVVPMLAFNKILILIPQLLLLAFMEEITFRAFFQERLSWFIKPHLSIIVTSVIFALGHFTRGSWVIVGYDLLFIFINSIIYGYIFHKTKNVYVNTCAHFMANLLGVSIFYIL